MSIKLLKSELYVVCSIFHIPFYNIKSHAILSLQRPISRLKHKFLVTKYSCFSKLNSVIGLVCVL